MTKISQIVIRIAIFISFIGMAFAQTAALLPNAVQQFFDNNGNPLSAGTVTTYSVGTSTLKTTWRDAAETIPNTNPIVLDAGGKAIIYGDGNYRQVLRDRLGNLIWDAPTSAFGSGGATLVGDGTAVGTILPWSGLIAPSHYVFAYGQELSRVTYVTLFNATTLNTAVNCSSGSPILTGIADTSQISPGPVGTNDPIEATCLPPGTTVVSKTASTVTVSNNATVSVSVNARFFPYGNGNGTTTFNVPDLRGYVLAGRNNMGGTAGTQLTTLSRGNGWNGLGVFGGTQTNTLITGNLPAYTPAGTIVSTQGSHTHFLAADQDINTGAPSNSNNSSQIPSRNTNAVNVAFNLSTTGTAATVGLSSSASAGAISSAFTGTAQGGASTPFVTVQPTVMMNYIIKILPDTSISTLNVVTSINAMTGDFTCSTGISCLANVISNSGVTSLGGLTGSVICGGSVTCAAGTISATATVNNCNVAGACPTSSSTVVAKTANYTVVNGDKGSTLSLGGNAQFTLTVNAASGYDADFCVNVTNADLYTGASSGRGKKLAINGVSLPYVWLYPQQSKKICNQSNVWVVTPFSERWRTTATIQLYVASGGSDANNDGLDSTAPLAFVSTALEQVVFQSVDAPLGSTIKAQINVAAGTINDCLHYSGAFPGQEGRQALDIIGAGSTSTTLNCASTDTVFTYGGANLYLRAIKLTSGAGSLLSINNGSNVITGADVNFGTAAAAQIFINNGFLRTEGDYSITGNAPFHVQTVLGGKLQQLPITVTCTGTPAFTQFSYNTQLSYQGWGATFSGCGGVTGQRYQIFKMSVTETSTGAGSATYFPGNVAGSAASGTYYDAFIP